jgi:hypothetical protein
MELPDLPKIPTGIAKVIMNRRLRKKLKVMGVANVPKDVLADVEKKYAEFKQEQELEALKKQAEPNQLEKLYEHLPFEAYEVYAHCDMCNDLELGETLPNKEFALQSALQNQRMFLDEKDVMHNHKTVIVKINRELELNSDDIQRIKDQLEE